MLGSESNDSVEIHGRNGKTYTYQPKPAVSVENPQTAKKAAQLLTSLGSNAPEGGMSMRRLRKTAYDRNLEAEANSPICATPANILVKHGDFRTMDWLPWEGKVSLIIADPPWLDNYADLREPLARLCRRLLRENGVCLVYCGQSNLPEFVAAFGRHLDWQWLITCVNENTGGAMRVGNICTESRPVLMYANGTMNNPTFIHDVVRTKCREKDLHPMQFPVSEAEHFVRILSRPGDLIVDPCLGFGTVATAVAKVGQGRQFVGCDVNPHWVRIASRRVAETASIMDASRAHQPRSQD